MARKRFPDTTPTTKVNYVGRNPTSVQVRKCVLVITSEPNPRQLVFEKDTITIGAMADNDVVLNDDTVSRHHAVIVQEEGGYVIKDLASTNGVFVDDVRVREAFLRPGCVVTLGKTTLRFDAKDEDLAVRPVERDRLGGLLGTAVRMREIFGIIEKIAPTSATVVIEGETGTGKEVVAKAIHALSTRANGPFIVFDCGAVPDNLIESELFGHEKGSFTGAVMSRRGLFEMAQGGTIFLDELGELNLELQPKLLRVLEQREVRRVGSNKPIKVDVRVIAATNRDLEAEVRAGRFREDLFYRLSVVRIFLPPLRERREDIPLLIRHFLANEGFNRKLDGSRRVEEVTRPAMEALMAYSWPGNVRELINVLERACSFSETGKIDLDDLPPNVVEGRVRGGEPGPAALVVDERAEEGAGAMEDTSEEPGGPAPLRIPERSLAKTFKDAKEEWVGAFERDYILHLLTEHKMNISHAARAADIDRKYFRKLMRKHGIVISELVGEGRGRG